MPYYDDINITVRIYIFLYLYIIRTPSIVQNLY